MTQISEILPLHEKTVTMQELYTLQPGTRGGLELLPTGLQPHFLDRLTLAGERLPNAFFAATRPDFAG